MKVFLAAAVEILAFKFDDVATTAVMLVKVDVAWTPERDTVSVVKEAGADDMRGLRTATMEGADAGCRCVMLAVLGETASAANKEAEAGVRGLVEDVGIVANVFALDTASWMESLSNTLSSSGESLSPVGETVGTALLVFVDE